MMTFIAGVWVGAIVLFLVIALCLAAKDGP